MAPDSTTIDINKSLKEYLNRNEAGTSEEKSNLLKSWSSDWNVKSWFRRSSVESEDVDENSSWLKTAEKDFFCSSLSKRHRIAGFMLCIIMGVFCFSLAFFYLPVLLLKVRKFCLLYSLGNLFFFGSFSFLWGPCTHLKHLFSCQRLPFTSFCFGSMFLTLYSALWLKSSSLTLLFAACQTVAIFWLNADKIGSNNASSMNELTSSSDDSHSNSIAPNAHVIKYTISYIPGSTAGLKIFMRVFRLRGSKSLISV